MSHKHNMMSTTLPPHQPERKKGRNNTTPPDINMMNVPAFIYFPSQNGALVAETSNDNSAKAISACAAAVAEIPPKLERWASDGSKDDKKKNTFSGAPMLPKRRSSLAILLQ